MKSVQRVKDELIILKKLQQLLGGRCGNTCPKSIDKNRDRYCLKKQPSQDRVWFCADCAIMFAHIIDLSIPRKNVNCCPCDNLGDEAIVVLDEYIENLHRREILTRVFII